MRKIYVSLGKSRAVVINEGSSNSKKLVEVKTTTRNTPRSIKFARVEKGPILNTDKEQESVRMSMKVYVTRHYYLAERYSLVLTET